MSNLPSSTPEAQGVASAEIERFLKTADETVHLHSFMFARHGKVVCRAFWKPYNPDTTHMMYSLSKSFTSTAIGFLESEGKISLDDRLVDIFADRLPGNVSPYIKEVRIRDMLAMATGMAAEPIGIWDEVKGLADIYLNSEVVYKPGQHFLYSSFDTYMLSAIVTRITGQKLFDYLKPRLIDPLGITGSFWTESPDGINMGGWGYNLKTEDIVRFGLLYVSDGIWEGKRILPKGWVAKASSAHSRDKDNPNPDWNAGYCYKFWRNRPCGYRADGMHGQFCLILPEYDAVIAITAGEINTQLLLDTVWNILLPAMKDKALDEDSAALQSLNRTAESLNIKVLAGATYSPLEKEISGRKLALKSEKGKEYTAKIEFDKGICKIIAGNKTFSYGSDEWLTFIKKGIVVPGTADMYCHCAGKYRWSSENKLQLATVVYDTPYTYISELTFDGGKVTGETHFLPDFSSNPLGKLEGVIE